MCFPTFEDGYLFYQNYGREVGFDTRKHAAKKCADGSQYKWRYACCNRQGFYPKEIDFEFLKEDGSLAGKKAKRRRITRCGCPARLSFVYEGENRWLISSFVEHHNHLMVGNSHKSLMKGNRSLDDIHKKFLMDCAKINIGTTDTYKFLAEILGGEDGVGCTLVDMRNYVRDMRAHVSGMDAQMLLNDMKRKKELSEAFFYTYEVDGEQRLKSLFWADDISRNNYRLFGDVVSFDTTYSTNRYCMIFTPFTGKDNHGRPVTFACGLLSNEDADSFSWLFNQFICCMGEEPKLIITDQDLGMKSAVKRVFSDTRHRLCMWHIMVKLSVKVPKGLLSDEKFKKELSKCVWSDIIEPDEFDEEWNDICCRYGLKDNVWINSLYADRHNWVPAYFRDFPMSGLLRTTSLSESENSFFKRYTRSTSNFIEFWMKFNHGLDAQRKITERLDYVDQNSSPTMRTSLAIEKNASMLFTSKIFDIVQEEIVCSLSSCRISQIISMDVKEEYVVNDQENGDFIVVFNQEDETYCCGCKLFGRKGFLCRHIFFLLKLKGVNHIPQRYVLSRWMKSSLCNKSRI